MTAKLCARLGVFLRLNAAVAEVTEEGRSCRHLVVRSGALRTFLANVLRLSCESEQLAQLCSGCLKPYACGCDYYLLDAIPEGLRAAGVNFDGPQVTALLEETRSQHQQHLALRPSADPDAPVREPALALARAVDAQTPFALALVDAKQKYAHMGKDTLVCVLAKRDLEVQALRGDRKRILQQARRHDARDAKRRPSCHCAAYCPKFRKMENCIVNNAPKPFQSSKTAKHCVSLSCPTIVA